MNNQSDVAQDEHKKGIGLGTVAVVFGLTALALVSVFNGARWRAENELLPRFCEDPQKNLTLVRKILTEDNPADGGARRPYIIAAKLLYILPRRDGEPVDAYITRLDFEIQRNCR